MASDICVTMCAMCVRSFSSVFSEICCYSFFDVEKKLILKKLYPDASLVSSNNESEVPAKKKS